MEVVKMTTGRTSLSEAYRHSSSHKGWNGWPRRERGGSVQASVTNQIDALRRMTVSELKVKWRELYGEDTRSCNRAYLWRRLAWRVQELAYGGLSERAKARI